MPAVDLHQLLDLRPPGEGARDGDRLAVGHRSAQLHDAAVVVALGGRAHVDADPAFRGQGRTFTKVTCSSTTLVKTPRSAASCSTDTSSAASSPETSTVTELGMRPASAYSTVPSFWVSGSQGRTSSPTTPVSCTFTASGTNSLPARAARTARRPCPRGPGPRPWRPPGVA